MDRREKEKAKARKTSAREWAETKESSWEPTWIKLPEGKKQWKPTAEGIYKLDVIMYKVGKNNPRADEGMLHFERTVGVHNGLGIQGKDAYCCTVKCFNKRCYPCNWIDKNGGVADKKLLGKVRMQLRILMNVIDVTNDESKKEGIQVLNQAYGSSTHPSFGEMLKAKLNAVEEYADFAEPVGGYTLVCTVKQDSFEGNKPYMKIVNIELVKRKKDYDEDIVDEAICLDDCLIEKTWDEMYKIVEQVPEEDEGNGKASKPKDDEDEDDDEEEKPKARSKDEDDDEDEDPEEDEKPKSKAKSKDDDDEEDEEVESKRKPTAKQLGLKKGDTVFYTYKNKKLKCDIEKINEDGTLLSLEGPDGEEFKAVSPSDVKKAEAKKKDEDDDEDDKPASRKAKPKDDEEDEDDALDEDDEDDD